MKPDRHRSRGDSDWLAGEGTLPSRGRPRAIDRRRALGFLAFAAIGLVATETSGCTIGEVRRRGASADEAPAPPPGSIPPAPSGWREVFRDDFSGPRLSDSWEAFDGFPSSDEHVRWSPSMARIADGSLVLSGAPAFEGWATGAVSGWRMPRTYGLFEVRMRAIPHPVLSYHVLLWPADDQWPPEIDLAEGYRADRARTDAFFHWRDGEGIRRKRGHQVRFDATRATTYAVEWLPGSVRLLADGREFASMNGATVPDVPMWFGMQVEARATREGTAAAPDNGVTRHGGPPLPEFTEPVLVVDWVRICEPAGATPRARVSG